MVSAEIQNDMAQIGLDYSAAVARFMDSEEMFLKYFKRFFAGADDVVKQLSDAVMQEDHSAIERHAHSLKGLAGNMGINGIFNPAKKMVDDMRAGFFSEYKTDYELLLFAYKKAVDISHRIM